QRFDVGAGIPDFKRDRVLSQHLVDKAGRPFTVSSQIVSACSHAAHTSGVGGCLARHGAAFMQVVYQPAGRFWLLQGLETAVVGGIGLALIAFAAVWLQRRAS